MSLQNSFIYEIKKRGPNIDPGWTPYLMFLTLRFDIYIYETVAETVQHKKKYEKRNGLTAVLKILYPHSSSNIF